MMKHFLFVAACFSTFYLMARGESNPWRFSVGPAWRSQVKTSLSGDVTVPLGNASHTVEYDKDIEGTSSWTVNDVVTKPDPDKSLPAGTMIYAVQSMRTETTITPGVNSASMTSSEEDSPLGFKMGVGYDFYNDDNLTIGFDLKFAAFWDMESAVSGFAGGGIVRVKTAYDYFLFESGPYPGDSDDFSYALPTTTPHLPYREELSDVSAMLSPSSVRAMLTSDLYQIGVGPRLGWSAFKWLDVYVGVSLLCNIAAVDFDVKSVGESVVECKFGVGVDMGFTAWVSENFGLYAEVGYEWSDESSVRNGGLSAEVDYSSLIVSVGGVVRF